MLSTALGTGGASMFLDLTWWIVLVLVAVLVGIVTAVLLIAFRADLRDAARLMAQWALVAVVVAVVLPVSAEVATLAMARPNGVSSDYSLEVLGVVVYFAASTAAVLLATAAWCLLLYVALRGRRPVFAFVALVSLVIALALQFVFIAQPGGLLMGPHGWDSTYQPWSDVLVGVLNQLVTLVAAASVLLLPKTIPTATPAPTRA